eukprot:COSAG02_NODE_3293_length_6997_cov_1.765729_6_plen_159_part_00
MARGRAFAYVGAQRRSLRRVSRADLYYSSIDHRDVVRVRVAPENLFVEYLRPIRPAPPAHILFMEYSKTRIPGYEYDRYDLGVPPGARARGTPDAAATRRSSRRRARRDPYPYTYCNASLSAPRYGKYVQRIHGQGAVGCRMARRSHRGARVVGCSNS